MDEALTRDFEEFALSRSRSLYRQAWALCGDAHRAEDLVQETLAKVYLKWRRIDTPYAYAQRTLMRAYLSHRRRRSSTEQPWAEVPDQRAASSPADLSDLRIALQEALAGLGPTDRAVVVLRYLEDLSVAETADRLGLSQGAVKNRSLRALRAMREESLR